MKFVILVEGHTEEDNLADFISRWINPKIKQPVKFEIDRFAGCTDFDKRAAEKTKDHLSSPQAKEIIAVIGLIDLYGPKFYPPDKNTVQQRYEWAVTHFTNEVNQDKFRMFLAVHELEAWLLSQPEIFPPQVAEILKKECRTPEIVNFNEPPFKFLHRIYKEKLNKGYKKTVQGRNLFPKLDPDIAYNKCPYLKAMLDQMLELAQKTG
ncbi:DUF4276 family protein [Planctomycetota bacterium]